MKIWTIIYKKVDGEYSAEVVLTDSSMIARRIELNNAKNVIIEVVESEVEK